MIEFEYKTLRNMYQIARKHGYEAQSRQLMEECAELIQATNKYWRSTKSGSVLEVAKAREHMIEEIADVLNMLEQIMFLTGCLDEIEPIIVEKVDRELERIKEVANKEICRRRDTPGIK